MRFALVWIAVAGPAIAQQQPMVANTPSSPPRIMVTNSPPPPGQVIVPPRAVPPGPPPPPYAHIIRPPQPRAAPSSYITPDDYPASARAMKQQGRVDFILIVGKDGRVAGCNINRSSGSPALDSTTCSLMRRRARFTPAIDSNGNPAVAPVRMQYVWRLG
jgi:protein TonB